jgi:hypothetical protein
MKRLGILAAALAVLALVQPAHAFGGRSFSRQRVVVRQQVIVQRQRVVVAQPVVVQQVHAVQQFHAVPVQQVVVPSCNSFFVH